MIGSDFSEGMLELARGEGSRSITWEWANALDLPVRDDRFDAVTVGFGARNFSDLDAGLREMTRVTRPGGHVVVLEITTPTRPPLSTFYRAWFDSVVPLIGRVAGDSDAYTYLPNSVKRFPGPHELAQRLAAAGLDDVRYLLTAGGIIAIHAGRKPLRRDRGAEPPCRDDRDRRARPRRRRRTCPALLRAVEARLREDARGARPRRSTRTAARRSRRAASACARCSSCSRPARRRGRAGGGARPRGGRGRARPQRDARPRRRARRAPTCAAGSRRSSRSGGRALAVATGDLLFARAFAALTQSAEPEAGAACSATRARRSRAASCCSAPTRGTPTIDVERYLLRCELKTARLFEAACRLGPLATAQPQVDLGGFGRRIGLAFQLLDDVLDVSGPAERTGKHRGTDLLDGTVTLPLIVARERDEDLAQRRPAQRHDRRPRRRRSATASPRPAHSRPRVARTRARRGGQARARRERPRRERTTALALVADSVVERYR